MKTFKIFGLLCIVFLLFFTGCANQPFSNGNKTTGSIQDVEQDRREIEKKAQDTLLRLYKEHPSAKSAIEDAYGYAVFDNFGLKIMLVGGGSGHGIAVNNKTNEKIYMKMVELQGGIGLGGKSFSVIMIFENKDVFDKFVDVGWEFGGQATAAAKHGEEGEAIQGAVLVTPGIWMFQMTDSGLEAAITVKGTKYYKDDKLN